MLHHGGAATAGAYSASAARWYQQGASVDSEQTSTSSTKLSPKAPTAGSRAFVDCELYALIDLFDKYALPLQDTVASNNITKFVNHDGLKELLNAVGENPSDEILQQLFAEADADGNGVIDLNEFLEASDSLLGSAPAGIVLLVGGPGCGKGMLSKRLEEECGVVHLSSGDLLRNEVRRDTVLGRQVKEIMARGELVSSAVIVKLIQREMRENSPGKRVLLDGFPRSSQNAQDLLELCGTPELAIHLHCEDTTMIARILKRKEKAVSAEESGGNASSEEEGTAVRADDDIHSALRRISTYHKSQKPTMDWLNEQHVPIINLDGSGTPEQVWNQLLSIGKLMRPACAIDPNDLK
ncbi:MAG: hypothetical protein SGILL_005206 [Bacillariaceae sp.]